MSEQRAYCRVYWSIVDDPKFVEVYDSDTALATWLRLLIIADQAWPASASLPASAKRRVVELLVRVGLVDTLPGWRYRIHGLDAERNRRADSARKGAAVRWQSERIATAPDVRMPSRAEPSQAENEPSQAVATDPADDYWNLTGKYPTDKVLGWLDDMAAEFGAATVGRHLAARVVEDRTASTLMGRVQDSLRREARQLDKREQDAERARVAANRPPKGVNVSVLMARHNHGAHADDPDDNCPSCRRKAA